MMSIALIATLASSLLWAAVIILDSLLLTDLYEGRAKQAWFVSSVAGSILGLLLTACIWIGAVLFGYVPDLLSLFTAFIDIFWLQGLLMFGAGALGAQILLHYFRCFAEEAHGAAIASWLAATPVFVLGAAVLLNQFVTLKGVESIPLNGGWIFGVLLATGGLVIFEQLSSNGGFKVTGTYRKELALMLFFNIAYTLVLKEIFAQQGENLTLITTLALLPWYWLGFGAGIRVMLKRDEREFFKQNWKHRMRYFAVAILIVEIVGMLTFYTEYWGLTALDPVYVNLIIAAHVLLVYALNHALGYLRKHLERVGTQQISIVGIPLSRNKLPIIDQRSSTVTFELVAITLSLIGIMIATSYIL